MADGSKPLRFTGRAAMEVEGRAPPLPADAIALQACAAPQQQAALLEASLSADEVLATWLTSDDTALGRCTSLFAWLAGAASSERWRACWLPQLCAGTRKLSRAAVLQLLQKVFLSALGALQLDTARLLLPTLAAHAPEAQIDGAGPPCARCRTMSALPPTRAMLLAVQQALFPSGSPAAAAAAACAARGSGDSAASLGAARAFAVRFLAREIYAPDPQVPAPHAPPSAAPPAALLPQSEATGDASVTGASPLLAASIDCGSDVGGAASASAAANDEVAFVVPPPCEHASPLEDPVHAAAAMGDAQLLHWLSDAGYSLSAEPPGWRVWPCPRIDHLQRDRTHRTEMWFQRCCHDTALNIAIREGGSVAAVSALIAAGADPGAVSCCVHHRSNGEGTASVVVRCTPAQVVELPVAAVEAAVEAPPEAAAAGTADLPPAGGAGVPAAPLAAAAPAAALAAAAVGPAGGAAAVAAGAVGGGALPPQAAAAGAGAAIDPAAAAAEPTEVQAMLVPCSPVLSAVTWGRDEILMHLLSLSETELEAPDLDTSQPCIDLQAVIPAPLLPSTAAVLVDQPTSSNLANLQRRVAPLLLASAGGRDSDDCCWAVGRACRATDSRAHESALAAAAAARAAALHSLSAAARQLMREAHGNPAVTLRQPLFISAGAVLNSLAASLRLPREWASETLVEEASLHGGSMQKALPAAAETACAADAVSAGRTEAGPAAAEELAPSRSAGSLGGVPIDVMAVLERVCPWTALHAAAPRTVGLQAILQAIDANRLPTLDMLMHSDALPAHRLPTVVRAFVAARAAATGVPLRRADALVSEAVLLMRPDIRLLSVGVEARLPAAVHAMRLLNEGAGDPAAAPAEGAAAAAVAAASGSASVSVASSEFAGQGAVAGDHGRIERCSGSIDSAVVAAAVERGIEAASQQFCSWYFGRRQGEPPEDDRDGDALADGMAMAIFRAADPLAFGEAPPDSFVRQEANLRLRVGAVVQAAASALAYRAWRRRRHALLCKAPL